MTLFYRKPHTESVIIVSPFDRESAERYSDIVENSETRLILAVRINVFDPSQLSVEKQRAHIRRALICHFLNQTQSDQEKKDVLSGTYPMRDRMSFPIHLMEEMAKFRINVEPIYDLPSSQSNKRVRAPSIIDLTNDSDDDNDGGSGDNGDDHHADNIGGEYAHPEESDDEDEPVGSDDSDDEDVKLPDYGVKISHTAWYYGKPDTDNKNVEMAENPIHAPTAIFAQWFSVFLTLLEMGLYEGRRIYRSIRYKEQANRWLEYLMHSMAKLTIQRIMSLHRIKRWREIMVSVNRSWLKLPPDYYDCSGCTWCRNDQAKSRLSDAEPHPYYEECTIPSYRQFIVEFFSIPFDHQRMHQNLRKALLPNPAAFAARIRRLEQAVAPK